MELQGELNNESWSDYTQRFVDDFNADQAPDITLQGHEMVGGLGELLRFLHQQTENPEALWSGDKSISSRD
jgi:hypothetical protein